MKSLSNFSTIIIGANGYIGRNLSYMLYKKGIKNYDFDISEIGKFEWMKYEKLDITNKEDFRKINPEIDVIFFMAGITGTLDGFALSEKYINVNLVGLINLLNHVKDNNIKSKIIFPSTRLVYKGVENSPLKEDAEKSPNSIYAITKLACENLLELYHKMFDIQYNILRICVPYGNLIGRDYSYGTIGFFINQAKKDNKIIIYGDGSQKRTFTNIKDICNILIETSKNRYVSNMTYNIGGENFSLNEVATEISKYFSAKIEYVDWPITLLKMESGDTIFDSNKLNKAIDNLKYESFNEWIKQLI
jgi:UDP-glucose 4-epimerase